jgi:predicted enzyme related to lactoylglutathione lyase
MSSPSFAAGAVIYAKDPQRLANFYRQVVGLVVAHTESEYVVLESPALQLVLHSIPAAIAAQITISTPPIRREGTAVKLVFPVSSIHSARSLALALGGALHSQEREWQFQDCIVCDGCDPEGNVIQLREQKSAL